MMVDLALASVIARYQKKPNGSYYRPPAETMWADARALITHVEDLEHELRLARKHLDDCPRWHTIQEETAAKRLADR